MTDTAQTSSAVGFQSNFLTRVASYSLVNYAQSCYTSAKAKNSLLKFGLEMAENNVARFSTPVLSVAQLYGKPYLESADQFGCTQLDKLETNVLPSLQTAYTNSTERSKQLYNDKIYKPMQNGKEKVTQWKAHTYTTVVNFPVDVTTRVLNVTEAAIDFVLPPSADEPSQSKSVEQPTIFSTIHRVNDLRGKLTSRGMQRMFAGFNNLKLRTQQQLNSMPYVVSLLDYAQQNFDNIKTSSKASYEKCKPYFETISVDKVWQTVRELSSYLAKPLAAIYERFVVLAQYGAQRTRGYAANSRASTKRTKKGRANDKKQRSHLQSAHQATENAEEESDDSDTKTLLKKLGDIERSVKEEENTIREIQGEISEMGH